MTSTIGDALRAQVAARASSTMLVCDDDRLTYADADRRSRAIARGLLAIGAGRGTHVAILFPTGVEFVVTWLAVTRIGAVAVPISTFSTGDELRGLLADADIDVLVTIDGYRGHDYVDRLVHTVGADVTRPDGFATAAVPALRHVFVAGPADGRGGRAPPRRVARGGRRDRRPARRRGGGRRVARRSHDHRLHVGVDERTQGRDPHARRAHPARAQPQRVARSRRGRQAVLQLAPLLDRRPRVQRRRHGGRRLDARVLDEPRRWRHPGSHRARASGAGERLRAVDRQSRDASHLRRP